MKKNKISEEGGVHYCYHKFDEADAMRCGIAFAVGLCTTSCIIMCAGWSFLKVTDFVISLVH